MSNCKVIETKKQAVEYLNNVMANWREFLSSHKPFEQALRVLLKEASK